MTYTKQRLDEALQIIGRDTRARHALEAAKLCQTQYRDSFHLRRSTAVHNAPVHIWKDDYSSDEDFDPRAAKRRRASRKDGDDENGGDREERSKDRTKTKIDAPGTISGQGVRDSTKKKQIDRPGTSFVTLRFQSARGRHFLSERLEENPGTRINAFTEEREKKLEQESSPYHIYTNGISCASGIIAGSSVCVYKSANQTLFTSNAERDDESDENRLATDRALRSGKIRSEAPTRKRKKISKEQEVFVAELKAVEKSKRRRVDMNVQGYHNRSAEQATRPSDENLPEQGKTPSSGGSAHQATATESSDDEVEKTTTPLSSPPSPRCVASQKKPVQTAWSAHASPSPLPSSSIRSVAQYSNSDQSIGLGKITTVITHFSHPINFRCMIPADCNFHHDYRHPILGHGKIAASLAIFPGKPHELIEMGDGHRANNIAPDEMCINCAFSYMQIARCPLHTFKPTPQTPARMHALRDHGKHYVKDLFHANRNDPARTLKAPTDICSLCPAPASYRCCAAQDKDKTLRPCRKPGESIEEAQARVEQTLGRRSSGLGAKTSESHPNIQPPLLGCDLVLCKECHDLVATTCAGRMQENRNAVLRHVRARRLPARADVEFLFKDSLLWKYYNPKTRAV